MKRGKRQHHKTHSTSISPRISKNSLYELIHFVLIIKTRSVQLLLNLWRIEADGNIGCRKVPDNGGVCLVTNEGDLDRKVVPGGMIKPEEMTGNEWRTDVEIFHVREGHLLRFGIKIHPSIVAVMVE